MNHHNTPQPTPPRTLPAGPSPVPTARTEPTAPAAVSRRHSARTPGIRAGRRSSRKGGRPRVVVAGVAAVLLLGTAGCADAPRKPERTQATAPDAAASQAPSKEPLARLAGPDHLALTITEADRDPSGFLTLRGTLTNNGTDTTVVPAELRGTERHVLRNGQSLAGATLIDFHHRKRYYVLRDAEGRPLTTTGLQSLEPHESAAVFWQFPAPPATTTDVGLQLPQFDTATLRITP
ncbi:hypothetical protein [Streptomyces bicolor]|uniref:hypothetical protein n=1 Tax=Streptomyces bicolor TaxID=66874 RepID=UPI001F41521A|nr:hypothetical protein [Streptomyces bicolor]